MSTRYMAVAVAFASLAVLGTSCAESRPLPPLPDAASEPVSFREEVAPVLEHRCVVCHGCYDAPCQLQLSSWEGIDRGASKQRVYRSSRLAAAEPTRLFVDAFGSEGWRQRGFFSVLDGGDGAGALLVEMLALGHANPCPRARRHPHPARLFQRARPSGSPSGRVS